MRKIGLFLFTLLACQQFSTAQGTIPMDKKKFREDFTQGSLEMMEHFYDTALTTFLQIRQMDTANANVNYLIGQLYLQTHTKKYRAERYLTVALTNVSKKWIPDEPSIKCAPPLAYYYMAQALHINNNFQRAIDFYAKFKDLPGRKDEEMIKDIERRKEMCFTALELMKNPVNCRITDLGDSVNSPFGDYSPLLSAGEDAIMFTSNRKGVGGDGYMTPEGDFLEDIWISYKKPDGGWTGAKSIGPTINTPGGEATVGLSADGQTMFIYRDDNGDGNIYISELSGDLWSIPDKVANDKDPQTDVNSESWEPSATITADGNTIYFVSDRKGGYGGTDIYKVVRLPSGQWSMAQNLGSTINTAYNEDAPFMHPDGKTLFFSSTGHKVMGGFDIFYSIKTDTSWTEPTNLGYPINTADDDIYYVTSADGKRGYYASVRPGGVGDKDLYRVDMMDDLTGAVVVFKGFVTYNGTPILPPSVHIRVKDNTTGQYLPDIIPNSRTGKYIIVLTPGMLDVKDFTVSFEADSIKPIEVTVKVERKNGYQEIEKPIELHIINLVKLPPGTITLSGTVKGSDGVIIPYCRVSITDNLLGVLLHSYRADSVNGSYSINLDPGKNYSVSFEATGYLFQSVNVISPPTKKDNTEIVKDILLDKIKVGVKITLNNIFFDSGKSNLRKESNSEMEKVIRLMTENPAMRIEMSGHTDNKGSDALNKALSLARAQSVVNYLVSKGIPKKRLVAKGYGKTMPVAPNNLPDGKPDEEGMQKNRRVEMKLID